MGEEMSFLSAVSRSYRTRLDVTFKAENSSTRQCQLSISHELVRRQPDQCLPSHLLWY